MLAVAVGYALGLCGLLFAAVSGHSVDDDKATAYGFAVAAGLLLSIALAAARYL